VIDLAHPLFQVALPDGADVLGGVHVGGADVVAHAALDAARDLDDGLVGVVVRDYLLEALGAHLRGQLGHGLALHGHHVRVHTGVHILAGEGDGARRAQIHAQGAPAAAAVVDGGTPVSDALGRVLGQARDLDHGDCGVVADLLAGVQMVGVSLFLGGGRRPRSWGAMVRGRGMLWW